MNYVRCSKCSWFHIGIPRNEAEKEVKEFNQFYMNMPKETRDNYGSPLSIDKYERCFRCNGSYKNMIITNINPNEMYSTIQSINYQ
jgi:hypothetical protein